MQQKILNYTLKKVIVLWVMRYDLLSQPRSSHTSYDHTGLTDFVMAGLTQPEAKRKANVVN